jgi:hypothetical protein
VGHSSEPTVNSVVRSTCLELPRLARRARNPRDLSVSSWPAIATVTRFSTMVQLKSLKPICVDPLCLLVTVWRECSGSGSSKPGCSGTANELRTLSWIVAPVFGIGRVEFLGNNVFIGRFLTRSGSTRSCDTFIFDVIFSKKDFLQNPDEITS